MLRLNVNSRKVCPSTRFCVLLQAEVDHSVETKRDDVEDHAAKLEVQHPNTIIDRREPRRNRVDEPVTHTHTHTFYLIFVEQNSACARLRDRLRRTQTLLGW